jgi:hypothetical protein
VTSGDQPPGFGHGLRGTLRRAINRFGFDLVRLDPKVPADIDAEDGETIGAVRDFTMTSPERIHALCAAVRYVTSAGIPGGFVECGVWKGGSMMAIARTLLRANQTDRDLYLFDTFEGMSPPTDRDVAIDGRRADDLLRRSDRGSEKDEIWCYAPLDAVRAAMTSTGYPAHRIHFFAGAVEDTVPSAAPPTIALLRLDTDWYESTRHEIQHLYPRLARGGVLIVDDYGHWRGARAAIDEYIARTGAKLLLNRIDYSGRLAIKALD